MAYEKLVAFLSILVWGPNHTQTDLPARILSELSGERHRAAAVDLRFAFDTMVSLTEIRGHHHASSKVVPVLTYYPQDRS